MRDVEPSGRCWRRCRRGWLAASVPGQSPTACAARRRSTVVKAARLIDGQGGAPLANPVVVDRKRPHHARRRGLAASRRGRGDRPRRRHAAAGLHRLPHPPHRPARRELLRRHVRSEPHRRRGDRARLCQAHARGRVHDVRDVGAGRVHRRRDAQRHQPRRHRRVRGCRWPTLARERDRRPRRPVGVLAVPVVQEPSAASPTASTRSASWFGPRSSTAPT